MNSGSSGSIVERIIAWLRGFLGSPQGAQRDTSTRQQTGSTGQGAATSSASTDRATGDITEPLRGSTTSGTTSTSSDTTASDERQVLPDLDDSESEYAYTGSAPGTAESTASDEERTTTDHSDFEDAGGDEEPDEASYPGEGSEDGMDEIHDAVGRHEADDDDERIDTSRDRDFAARGATADNVPEPRDEDVEGVSEQDELTAFDGASSDEFTAGGYAPSPTDQGDVEAASIDIEPGTDTPQGVAREEVESEAAGDAFAQGDEAVTAPGQSDADTFTDLSTGTTEPSRSATGNELDEEQDALGTTLEFSEDEEDAFDPDAANLSAEGELGVIDKGASAATGETSTQDPYADLPDEPVAGDPDDTGRDDFSGSDYPSDRRVDPLAGDDAFAAMEPDIDEATSSAGDLETDSGDETLTGEAEATIDTGSASDAVQPAIEQEMVGTSDEHVGGEVPEFVGNMQDVDVPSGESPGDSPPARSERAAASPDAGTDTGMPAGAVRGDGTTDTPPGYPVKGNANSKIYHLPAFPSYKSTKAEFCFATEQDAIAAGYRAPGRRNRGRSDSGASPEGESGIAEASPSGIDYEEPMHEASNAKPSPSATSDESGTNVDAPVGAVAGDGSATCPPGYPIKGNASSMIYHAPGRASYNGTVPEWCFATEEDALNAGYRAPKR